jgi:CheY-like chemotaxis protein
MSLSGEVLIVENAVPIQQLLSAIVMRNGLRPRAVSDGDAALAHLGIRPPEVEAALESPAPELASRLPDIVLLELMLPRTSGFEVLRQLASRAPHLLCRVIVITGLAPKEWADTPGIHEVWSIVRKPFDLEALEHDLLECYAECLRDETRKPARRAEAHGPTAARRAG